MSFRQQISETYSVFVGHIHPDVTKRELGDLFKACGDIMDVVILVSSGSAYNFGFVRYQKPEYAFRAVRELNSWLLNGCELVVDISKDTAKKIKDEKERDGTSSSTSQQQQRSQRDKVRGGDGPNKQSSSSSSGTSSASLFLQDTMYLNRLRENCSKLHLKASDGTGKVAPDLLLDDVGRADSVRFPAVWGSLSDPSVNFQRISHKIMQKCRNSSEVEPSLGEKKAVEYLNSLETIMQEISKVLATREDKAETKEADKEEAKEDKEAQQAEDEDLAVRQCLEEIRNVNCEDADGGGAFRDEESSESDIENNDLNGEDVQQDQNGIEGHNEDIPNVNRNESFVQSKSPKRLNIQFSCQSEEEDTISLNSQSGNIYKDKLTCLYENQLGKCVNCYPKDSQVYPNKVSAVSDNESSASRVRVKRNETSSMPIILPDKRSGLNVSNNSNSESCVQNRDSKTVVPSDPAILGFHLSKSKSQPKMNVLEELFANMTVRSDSPRSSNTPDMVRSVSRDSSMSSGSNDFNVDDSGVESDFHIRRQATVPAALDCLVDGWVGDDRNRAWSHGRPGRKSLPEGGMRPSNPITGNKFDIDAYLTYLGRGRGSKPGITKKPPTTMGRGILPMK